MSTAPFFAVDASRWPRMLARLRSLGPLEEDDARADLRYLENEHRVFLLGKGGGSQFPGRTEMMKRWGWEDRAVRKLLACDDWQDPNHPVAKGALRQPFKGDRNGAPKAPPMERQSPANDLPMTAPANADNQPIVSNAGPTPVQSMSIARASNETTINHSTTKENCTAGAVLPSPATECADASSLHPLRDPADDARPGGGDPRPEGARNVAPPAPGIRADRGVEGSDGQGSRPRDARRDRAGSTGPVAAKAKREKHPRHADLFALWTEAHRAATGEAYQYTGACAKRLTVILDERVPRDGDAGPALAALKAAIETFHRKPLDAFPAGWTVLGFAQDVNRWTQASRAGPPARGSPPTRGRLLHELFDEAEPLDTAPPALRPAALDADYEVLPA